LRDSPHHHQEKECGRVATGAERIAVQLPRAHQAMPSKKNDLAREAVGCNGVFGRSRHCFQAKI
jgi:hypothetical protein